MALHRADFSVTIGTGVKDGSDDAAIRLSVSPRREATLKKVRVDRRSAFAGAPCFTFNELTDVEDETWNDTDEVYALGKQLTHVDSGAAAQTRDQPENPYDEYVVSETLISTKNIRCLVTNALPGDVFTIEMYYETSGDWRF